MKFINSKTFYKRHMNEIMSLIPEEKSALSLVNSKSSFRNHPSSLETILVDPEVGLNIESIAFKNKKYKTIILTDLFEVSTDILELLSMVNKLLGKDGIIVICSINQKWNRILNLFERLNLKDENQKRLFINSTIVLNIAKVTGLEFVTQRNKQIFPFKMLGLGSLINNILEILFFPFSFGIRIYSILNQQEKFNEEKKYSKSIIIPAKNEEKNLKPLLNQIPELEEDHEIILAIGDSEDKTYEVAKEIKEARCWPFEVKVIKQTGKGKANAVWEAVEEASKEVIIILDADISVNPETIVQFNSVIDTGKASFVNGTRLIYGMESGAMRIVNNLGNRIFQYIVSIIIGQKITDSLCGTKVFFRKDFNKIKLWKELVQMKDPFGDFDMIFTAGYFGLKILEIPVRYQARVYGVTQIKRFRDGYKLIIYLLNSIKIFKMSSNAR
ncbi:MAG: glycosyltransferase family 2 protein [Actinomycetota bacterium]|nr:glycosyltransferase family 2 protein [Actinomycetota bacterium]